MADNDAAPPPQFESFAKLIENLDNQISVLNTFHTTMKSGEGVFFSEEIASVEKRLQELQAERTTAAAELQERVQLYENQVVQLKKTIAMREKMLESSESNAVMQASPQLMDLFARGHVHLQQELSSLCSRVFV